MSAFTSLITRVSSSRTDFSSSDDSARFGASMDSTAPVLSSRSTATAKNAQCMVQLTPSTVMTSLRSTDTSVSPY